MNKKTRRGQLALLPAILTQCAVRNWSSMRTSGDFHLQSHDAFAHVPARIHSFTTDRYMHLHSLPQDFHHNQPSTATVLQRWFHTQGQASFDDGPFQSHVRDSALFGMVGKRETASIGLTNARAPSAVTQIFGGHRDDVAELHAFPRSCIQHHEATASSKGQSPNRLKYIGTSRSCYAIHHVKG